MNPVQPRVKGKLRRRGGAGVASSSSGHRQEAAPRLVLGSPLDRLGDLILDWKILSDVKLNKGEKTVGSSASNASLDKMEDGAKLSLELPHEERQHRLSNFSSFKEYFEYYEPLLITELKAGVLQSAESVKRHNARCGVVHACEAESRENKSRGTQTIRLNLTFNKYPTEEQTSKGVEGDRDRPGNLDIVLISTTKGALPASKATQVTADNGEYMLALLTSGGGGKDGGGLQAKASLSRWDSLKEALVIGDRKVAAQKGMATKTARLKAEAGTAEIRDAIKPTGGMPVTSNGRRATVEVGRQGQFTASGGTGASNAAAAGGKSITRVGGLSSYQLHYIILDRLTSVWREYMALCECKSANNVPLLPDILADRREVLMEGTPPHNAEAEGAAFVSDDIAVARKGGELGEGGTDEETKDGATSGSPVTPFGEGMAFSPVKDDTPSQPMGIAKRLNAASTALDGDSSDGDVAPPPPPPESDDQPRGAYSGKRANDNNNIAPEPGEVSEGLSSKRARNRSESIDSTGDGDGSTLLVEDIPGLSPAFMGMLRSSFNHSQLLAVSKAAGRNSGFTLIQGPPGTGKTTTVVGILNTLHIREYNKYYEEVLSTLTGPEGITCRGGGLDPTRWLKLVAGLGQRKPHILVVAPSNIAVDNIIQRIMAKSFCDGNEIAYKPSMLRIGSDANKKQMGQSQSEALGEDGDPVRAVTLEETMEKEQLSAISEESRSSAMEATEASLRDLIAQLWTVQAALLNMGKAFQEYPLPKGWELRCDQESGRPYWVDHRAHAVHMEPPKPEQYNYRPSNTKPRSSGGAAGVTIKQEHVVDDDNLFGEKDDEKDGKCIKRESLESRRELSSHTLRTLPEYGIYANKAVQLIEQIDRLALFQARCKARINASAHGGQAAARQSIEASIIDGAHLVFTTLNSAGHPCLEGATFTCAVIDEAAQCVEPSSLIPLQKGIPKCIMVGDPLQLPATLISDKAKRAGYDRSLFERLIVAGHPYIMLDVQYRMAPAISAFPSHQFYKGRLRDGSNVRAADYCPPYIGQESTRHVAQEDNSQTQPPKRAGAAVAHLSSYVGPPLLSSCMFFDVDTKEISGRSISKSNPDEAVFCVNLLEVLVAEAFRLNKGHLGSIGIITPYQEQLSVLHAKCEERRLVTGNKLALLPCMQGGGAGETVSGGGLLDIELNTVDGFQGREKDFIIISTVRANEQGNIGFLSDKRRLNVAMTRPKWALFVVGKGRTLQGDRNWGAFLRHCTEKRQIVRSSSHADLFPLLQDSFVFEPQPAEADHAAKRSRFSS